MACLPLSGSLRFRVGNDVVDLQHPRLVGGSWSPRLEDRILAPEEREWLHGDDASTPLAIRFWSMWAAKETAYKILCKALGDTPVLVHRTFVSRLRITPSLDDTVEVSGSVRNGPLEAQLSGWASSAYVHLVGTGCHRNPEEGPKHPAPPLRLEMGVERLETGVPLESFRGDFTDREWEGVHGVPSARARILARTRLKALLAPFPGSLEIVTSRTRPGRTPPVVLADGTPRPDLELSLSHHGRYVAWALLLPPEQPGDQNSGR